ncbi:TonB-dependent receptor plug domain-containing protein [Olleya sp. AH-315-F22]|nr:TonB-dependent receptor plug domain-containing protein [Olleya sp. AH-315-F22]
MEYLIKASAIIAIFYFCYSIFLQRDTFFQSNRWFFVVGLITAILIPLVVIPIYITVQPQEFVYSVSNLTFTNENTVTPFDWNGVITTIYFLGVSIFATRLLIQIYSLVSLIIRNKKQRSGKFIYVEVEDNISPFSFFNWIVFNPNQFKQSELEQIITHEKVHVNQFHSIDILFIQIASVVFWCNPLIWIYKKELHQNLEFIADNEAQKQASCKKSYQHLLLKTSMPNYQMALTNNFYNSLIKKRIVMLHKNKSKNRNYWKFTLILPILALFIMSFNTKEIYIEKEAPLNFQSELSYISTANDINFLNDNLAEIEENQGLEKEVQTKAKNTTPVSISKTNKVSTTNKIVEVIITKDYTEADFNKIKEEFAKAGFTLKFKGIKRNNNGEIVAIKINASSEKSNANFNTKADDPIKPIKITIDNESNSISIGNGLNIHLVKGEDFSFISKNGNHKVHTTGKGNVYSFVSKDGKHKVQTTGKGSNVFVYRSDDKHKHDEHKVHDDDEHEVIIIRSGGKVQKIKSSYKSENVHIIHVDDDKILKLDDSIRFGNRYINKVRVLSLDTLWIEKRGNVVREWVSDNDNDKNIWISADDSTFEIKTIGKGNTKFFISGDSDKEPLFILDGKKVSKKVIDELDSDTIDKIEVLKGDSATKKYGKKAKDGVVIIITKKE